MLQKVPELRILFDQKLLISILIVVKFHSRSHGSAQQRPLAARDQPSSLPGASRHRQLELLTMQNILPHSDHFSGSIWIELQHFHRGSQIKVKNLLRR